MNMVFSEEQRLLADTARDFLEAHCPVAALRRLRDGKDGLGYDPEAWRKMVELGWTAMPFPEALGGLDFGYLGMGAVFEQMGRTLAASPLFATVVLGGSALALGGTPAQQNAHLPAIIAGERRFALAVDEGRRHDPAATALAARKTGDGYTLDGDKVFVLDGQVADWLVVAARTSGQAGERAGISLFLVEAGAPGLQRQGNAMLDSRNAARIRFNSVRVSADALLGRVDEAWDLLEEILDRGRACLAAEMLGIGQWLFDTTIKYLKERIQFDAPIGSFQALQHRAAWMYAELELARSAVMAGLAAVNGAPEERRQLVSLAKAKMGTVLERISGEAVQMHGGIGVTDELDVGLYLKRGRVARHALGDYDFHAQRYGEGIGLLERLS
ncbi:MAG: acyl-CoA dehydrogenase family protein [Rhodocyclaceae bacterium]|nr:acyl-CoA dehydrogenase family protein [Rhodocyclaceae bacterium]